uniref:RxLR effector protein n=1 Tax=Phakopsora pachyrhizi TaxID=170000 RepID=A0A0S1MJY0_PHAPC
MRCFIFALALLSSAQFVLGAGDSSQKVNRRSLVQVDALTSGRRPFNSGNSLVEVNALKNYQKDNSKISGY